jgi:hypothetical protein
MHLSQPIESIQQGRINLQQKQTTGPAAVIQPPSYHPSSPREWKRCSAALVRPVLSFPRPASNSVLHSNHVQRSHPSTVDRKDLMAALSCLAVAIVPLRIPADPADRTYSARLREPSRANLGRPCVPLRHSRPIALRFSHSSEVTTSGGRLSSMHPCRGQLQVRFRKRSRHELGGKTGGPCDKR